MSDVNATHFHQKTIDVSHPYALVLRTNAPLNALALRTHAQLYALTLNASTRTGWR